MIREFHLGKVSLLRMQTLGWRDGSTGEGTNMRT